MLGGITGKGFLPGKSGNPGGRKRKPITEAYEKLLTPAEAVALARAMITRAKKGDVRAAVEVTDRVEGKLTPEESEKTSIGVQVIVINGKVRPDASNASS